MHGGKASCLCAVTALEGGGKEYSLAIAGEPVRMHYFTNALEREG